MFKGMSESVSSEICIKKNTENKFPRSLILFDFLHCVLECICEEIIGKKYKRYSDRIKERNIL